MVGWECTNCNGSGKEPVIQIRSGVVKEFMDSCSECGGAGTFTNGKPDLYKNLYRTDDWLWK